MDHGSLLEPKTILQSMLRDVYSSNSYIYGMCVWNKDLLVICRLAVFELGDCSGVTPGILHLRVRAD